MTVIAYKDGVMAADGAAFSGGRKSRVGHLKITRAPDGSVAGASGLGSACYAFLVWFAGGSDPSSEPKWPDKDDECMYALIARPDGSLWRKDGPSNPYPVCAPYVLGENDAAQFTLGAMAAGLSAEDAVALAIKWSAFIGGDVQVERVRS